MKVSGVGRAAVGRRFVCSARRGAFARIIRAQGTIGQCLHPNALPFSSRKGDPPGFQVELGEAIAKQIGVALEPMWIVGAHQLRRAGCDFVTDAIAEPDVQEETGLQMSKPYYRTGIVLAVRSEQPDHECPGDRLAGQNRCHGQFNRLDDI